MQKPRRPAITAAMLAAAMLPLSVAAQDCIPGTWVLAETHPTPRFYFASTFDPARGKLLVFGGESADTGLPRSDLWEWDGSIPGRGGWARRTVTFSPPSPPSNSLRYCTFAFDTTRNQAVLLGGDSVILRGAWVWDVGSSGWTRYESPGILDYRALHSMAYDASRDRVLVFGGTDGGIWHNDLWAWNPQSTTWTQLVANSPLVAYPYIVMTYDARRDRGVFVDSLNRKLWEYNFATSTWTERHPQSFPSARRLVSLTFDPTSGHTFLFGGAFNSNNSVSYNDLWEWNGDAGTWTQRAVASPPSARYAAALVPDPNRRRLVLFGGTTASDTLKFDDLWEIDPIAGTQWTPRIPASTPRARVNHTLVYDPARRETILFGGSDLTTTTPIAYVPMNDTWIRPSEGPDAGAWVLQAPAQSPPARHGAGIAFDTAARRVVIFGGTNTSGPLSDTWEWESDTRQWIQRQTPLAPTPRYGPGMAFDSVRGNTILFGGGAPIGLNQTQFDDTWKWNSATGTWTPLLPPLSPPPRAGAAMSYDAARDRIVLFGGAAGSFGNQALADTWEFNPATESWTQLFPAQSPPATTSPSMTWSSDRTASVLFSGATFSSSTMWEWNGANWSQLSAVNAPRFTRTPIVFDSARHTLQIFGGSYSGDQVAQTTWEWITTDPSYIVRQPQPLSLHEGDTAAFAVACTAATQPTYQWRRNGLPLTDNTRITGSVTPVLRITPVTLSDAGQYDVIITGPCITLTSTAAALSTTCYANCDLSAPPPTLSVNDFTCFMNAYAANGPYANCDRSAVEPALNVADFICFMNRFAAGCP